MPQVFERTVKLSDGKIVKFTTDPRHPFWKISFETGPVPRELQGVYTDFDQALAHTERYLARREKAHRRVSVDKNSVVTKETV